LSVLVAELRDGTGFYTSLAVLLGAAEKEL
jgi:hypothetical protein